MPAREGAIAQQDIKKLAAYFIKMADKTEAITLKQSLKRKIA